MSLPEDFARFADEIREGSDGLMSELSFFPSGAIAMRIRIGTRLFDLDYNASRNMFGVGELASDAAFNTSYQFSVDDFHNAKIKMRGLIEDAKRNA